MSTLASPIDRLRELGGQVFLQDGRLRYRIPAGSLAAREIVTELRGDREAIIAMLQDQDSRAPSLAEVTSMLPPGIKLVSYQPKQAPFTVAPPVRAVTNAGAFYRAYLTELRWRLEHPGSHTAPPLVDILSKLTDAGLELMLDRRP